MSNLQRRLDEMLAPTLPVAFGAQKLTGVADPTAVQDLATKNYVDTGLALKAPLVSPALTGVPTVPTAAVNTNTTQAASTAFVQNQLSNTVPQPPVLASSAGGSLTASRADHVHSSNAIFFNSNAPQTLGGVTFTPSMMSAQAFLATSVAMTGVTQCFYTTSGGGLTWDYWYTTTAGATGLLFGSQSWSGSTNGQIGYNAAGSATHGTGILVGNGHVFHLHFVSGNGAFSYLIIQMVS